LEKFEQKITSNGFEAKNNTANNLDLLLDNKFSKRVPENLKHQRCRSMIGFNKDKNGD
jgi:hypothetical protein